MSHPTWIWPMSLHMWSLETCMTFRWLWHQTHWNNTCYTLCTNSTALVWGLSWLEWLPFVAWPSTRATTSAHMTSACQTTSKMHSPNINNSPWPDHNTLPKNTYQLNMDKLHKKPSTLPTPLPYRISNTSRMSWTHYSMMPVLSTPH